MIEVSILVAQQIDRIMNERISGYEREKLARTLSEGNKNGLIMHYHPFKEETEEEWFQWHNDYSILTALTSAMYLDGNGKQFTPKTGGLFCKNRSSEAVRIDIPEDMLAIQLGWSA